MCIRDRSTIYVCWRGRSFGCRVTTGMYQGSTIDRVNRLLQVRYPSTDDPEMPQSETMPNEPTVDVTIVLPVFNEVGHLQDEIDRIRKAMDNSRYSYEILVVDDG